MRVIIFGATGMVGQGVLRECLADPGVEGVLTIGRRPTGQRHPKLRELTVPDLTEYGTIADQLSGYGACFFCLGVSSAGMTEAEYRKVTVDIAVAAGRVLAERSPEMTFVFVSGQGSDGTGKSRVMWSRVKGEAENAILAMPFKGKFAFRPGFIRPAPGIASRTTMYRILYAILIPLYPVLKALFPKNVTTSEGIARAMLNVARYGAPKAVLETVDINAVAQRPGPA